MSLSTRSRHSVYPCVRTCAYTFHASARVWGTTRWCHAAVYLFHCMSRFMLPPGPVDQLRLDRRRQRCGARGQFFQKVTLRFQCYSLTPEDPKTVGAIHTRAYKQTQKHTLAPLVSTTGNHRNTLSASTEHDARSIGSDLIRCNSASPAIRGCSWAILFPTSSNQEKPMESREEAAEAYDEAEVRRGARCAPVHSFWGIIWSGQSRGVNGAVAAPRAGPRRIWRASVGKICFVAWLWARRRRQRGPCPSTAWRAKALMRQTLRSCRMRACTPLKRYVAGRAAAGAR